MKSDFEKLQNDYSTLSQEKQGIEKYNLALQDQLSKYALLLSDEKTEKKELSVKFDDLQKQYVETIAKHGTEKTKNARNFYLLLGLFILLLLIASVQFYAWYKAGFKR